MRLGFHYHVPAVYRDDSIYMPGYLGVFIDSLASRCKSITCYMHSPLLLEEGQMNYKIKAQNVTLVNIGPHVSLLSRLVRSYIYKKKIYKSLAELDIFLVRSPTSLIHIFFKLPIPVALLVVGIFPDKYQLSHLKFIRRFLNQLYYKWYNYNHLRVAKNAIVFANNEVSYRLLLPFVDDIIEIKTTTLNTKDIYIRNDRCEGKIIKLLFVGRFDRTKGLFELYDALSRLKNGNQEYHLYLAGSPAKGDTILDELAEFADKLGINHMITNLGYKEFGQELLDVYKGADIYVIPTKLDAFPRTIWEAMAHSLPVIATKVGGIPHRLTDELNAILIEPGDSKALADAINEVANNKQLRQKLIKEGRELASQSTLEIQSEKMINELERFLKEHDK